MAVIVDAGQWLTEESGMSGRHPSLWLGLSTHKKGDPKAAL